MSRENVEIVRNVFEGLVRGDVATFLDALDPEVEWKQVEEPRPRYGHQGVGEAIAQWLEMWVAPTFEGEEYIDGGRQGHPADETEWPRQDQRRRCIHVVLPRLHPPRPQNRSYARVRSRQEEGGPRSRGTAGVDASGPRPDPSGAPAKAAVPASDKALAVRRGRGIARALRASGVLAGLHLHRTRLPSQGGVVCVALDPRTGRVASQRRAHTFPETSLPSLRRAEALVSRSRGVPSSR
jgi:hypothetical protein